MRRRAAPRSTAPAAAPGSSPRRVPIVLDVDPAAARPAHDRGVRRPVRARTRRSCCSTIMGFGRRSGGVRRAAAGTTARSPSARRCGSWPTRCRCPSTTSVASGEVAVASETARHRGRAASTAGTVAGPAHDRLRPARRAAAAQLQRHLVLRHRPRADLGPAPDRLARRGRGRRPARRRAALPGPARAHGRDHARLHRQPGGQRGAGGLRGGTRDPHHRRPAAGHRACSGDG